MKKMGLVLLLLVFISGCNFSEEVSAINANSDENKIWTFIQFNVPEEKDRIESYYYYGLVSESLYEKISDNSIKSGFIEISQVRYWGDDDLVHDYESLEYTGELLFRIEDIRRIRKVVNETQVGRGAEQFEEPKAAVEKKVTPIKSKVIQGKS